MSAAPDKMKLMAYADGELDESERAEVEAWMATDAAAAETATSFAALGEFVKGSHVAKTAASFDIADAVMAKIAAEPAAAPARPKVVAFPLRRVTVVAAALALAAAVFLIMRPKDEAPIATGPGVEVDLHETPGQSVSVFYLPSETNMTTSVVVWVDETGAK